MTHFYYGRPDGLSDDEDSYSDESDIFTLIEPQRSQVLPPKRPWVDPRLKYYHVPRDNLLPRKPLRTLLRLQGACERGDVDEVVGILVELGDGSVDVLLPNKMTPLMTSILYEGTALFGTLLSRGASVSVGSPNHGLPVHVVFQSPCSDESRMMFLRALLDAGADVEASDSSYYTPFLWATEIGDLITIKFLCELGVRTNVTDYYGRNAVEIACRNGYADVVVYFQEMALFSREDQYFDRYVEAAGDCGFSNIANALEIYKSSGIFVLSPTRKPAVESPPKAFSDYEILGRMCPSGDLQVVNPLIRPGRRRCNRVGGSVRDVLIGVNMSRSRDLVALEDAFVAAGKTRLRDMFFFADGALDEMGVRAVGDRIALEDLPFLALKHDFDPEALVLDDEQPSERERNRFRNLAQLGPHASKMERARRAGPVWDCYKEAFTLPLAEAAYHNLGVMFSVMAAHVGFMRRHEEDPVVLVPAVHSDDWQFQAEAVVFMYEEALKTRALLAETRRRIAAEIARNPCISDEFESQKPVRLRYPVLVAAERIVAVCLLWACISRGKSVVAGAKSWLFSLVQHH